jgi:hypothetical protein
VLPKIWTWLCHGGNFLLIPGSVKSSASPIKNHTETLEKVQRRAARWACAKWDASSFSWNKSYEQCCSELKWLSLSKRRDLSISCQIYKIINHLDYIDFSKYLSLSVANTRRSSSLQCCQSRIVFIIPFLFKHPLFGTAFPQT